MIMNSVDTRTTGSKTLNSELICSEFSGSKRSNSYSIYVEIVNLII